MLERIFDSVTTGIINKTMDTAALRNQVIANNIANANTPYFKRSEVVFEDKLKKAMKGSPEPFKLKITDPRHFQIWSDTPSLDEIQPEIVQLDKLSYKNDDNNVDIDVEMANKTKNDILYDTMSRCMSDELKMLRLAITGR